MLDDSTFRLLAEISIFIKELFAAHYLAVDEVRSLLVKDLKVARLLDVEIHRHERPHCVIHPDSCDAVTVSDEFAASAADDGSVRAVRSDAAEVIDEHSPYVRRIHDYQRQAVLPEISPASAALAVIVVRQERASVDPSEHRLYANPVHPAVKSLVARVEAYVIFLIPVFLIFRKLALENIALQILNCHILNNAGFSVDIFLVVGGL